MDIAVGDDWNRKEPRTRIVAIGARDGVDEASLREVFDRCRDAARKPNNGIALAVAFSQLPDGTSYSSRTILDAKSKDIKVVVENSGHRPL